MRNALRAAIVAVSLLPGGFGYIRLMTTPPLPPAPPTPSVPLVRFDAAQIQFYINNQLLPGLQSSASGSNVTVIAPGADPVGAARAALATWNASGANVNFLPLQSTTLVDDPTDGKMVITLATTPADVSYVGGAVAITAFSYVNSSGQDPDNSSINVVNGNIIDSDILLNPSVTFTTDGTGSASGAALANGTKQQDLQAVLTHELGHSLGASHSGLLAATMFQYGAIDERYLSVDDLTFVKTAYPPSGSTQLGTISGAITASGGAPVAFGMLTMIDTAQKITLGGLTNSDGTYSLQVPPGNYVIYAEPFNSIIQPGNLYLSAAQAALVSAFETTFNGGPTTTVSVSAGATTTVNFSVNSGLSTLTLPFIGFGTTGKTGDVSTYSQILGPVRVPSGQQSVDLVFGGSGFSGTLTLANIAVLGGGVTATAIKADTSRLNLPGGSAPLQRLTLSIPATQTSTSTSIVITQGSTVLSMSAVLVITPPTPTFTSASLVSAASYANANGGAAVSPGGIATLFSTTGTLTIGPPALVPHGPLNSYNALPSTLSGVSVSFDGVEAPLFYVYAGQIGLQVPFEVAAKVGGTTNVIVNYNGAANAPVAVNVVSLQPAIFTLTSDGGADSIITNQDYATNMNVNSASNPARVGTYVTIYGTGVGVTSLGVAGYGLQTGVGAPGPPAGYPQGYTCTIGSTAVLAYFGGWTPTGIGLAQWTVQVPTGATGKLNLKCTDNASGVSTQAGTIYVTN